MNYTLSPEVCVFCSRRYRGYGSQVAHDDPDIDIYCSECKKKIWASFQYRIPEEPIKFVFISSYRHYASFNVTINDVYWMDDRSPIRIEYIGDSPALRSFEACKREGFNVHTEEDFQLKFGMWVNTLKVENAAMLNIPDNIFEAFKIYMDKPDMRRAYYDSKCLNPEAHISLWEWSKGRVVYY